MTRPTQRGDPGDPETLHAIFAHYEHVRIVGVLCHHMHFFGTFAYLSPAPVGLFSCSQLRGTPGARLYTTAQLWAPTELRDACPGAQSREIWQVIAGLLSDQLMPTRPMQTPVKFFFRFFTSRRC